MFSSFFVGDFYIAEPPRISVAISSIKSFSITQYCAVLDYILGITLKGSSMAQCLSTQPWEKLTVEKLLDAAHLFAS